MDPEDNGTDGQQSQGHPAWQDILSVLPDDLHPLVTPKLEEWDRGVQAKLQEYAQYQPYQPLIENDISPEVIQQALYLAHQFENNPEEVVEHAINAFNLEKFKQQQQQLESGSEDDLELDEDHPLAALQDHPAFKELYERAQQIQEFQQQQQMSQQEQEAAEALDNYLEELHEEHGDFDDVYVMTMLANGIDADEAIGNFQNLVKQYGQGQEPQNNGPTPPVVMGGAGNSGSGLPEPNVQLGKLTSGQTADLVAQYIQNAQSQDT